jgi:serine/threonine protein kinase
VQVTVVNNHYSIVHTLGRGGMAKVYLAHDEVLDRDVALKVLKEQFADDEEFVERFKRAAQSAASLSPEHRPSLRSRGNGVRHLLHSFRVRTGGHAQRAYLVEWTPRT